MVQVSHLEIVYCKADADDNSGVEWLLLCVYVVQTSRDGQKKDTLG